jgi:hypothetical protein
MPLGISTSLLKIFLTVKNHLVRATFSVRISSGWDFPFSPCDRMILMLVAGRRDLSCNKRNRISVSFWYGSEFVSQEGKGGNVEKSALDLPDLNQSFARKSSTLTHSTQDHG